MTEQEAAQQFEQGIDAMVAEHGEEVVLGAFERLYPNMDFSGVRSQLQMTSDPAAEPMEEVANPVTAIGAAAKTPLGKKALGALGGTLKFGGKTLGALLKGVFGLGVLGVTGLTGVASKTFGRSLDQDVKIDDVNPSVEMKTDNKDLESLLLQTNSLLTKMIAQFEKGVEDLDVSLDDLVAAETGESRADVQGRQATGASIRREPAQTKTKQKNTAKPPSPKKPAASKKPEDK